MADSPSGISLKNASAFPFAIATFANRRKSVEMRRERNKCSLWIGEEVVLNENAFKPDVKFQSALAH